ncbi:MAG: YhbY family RNA-binding protein [Rhodocyclales bacterium]|nr:YhbY family RNA-binding protein [Rhodocyclales bacterium]
MTELTSSLRRSLRARAHSLHPVASISQKGLSEAVLAEIDRGLKAHELIKVRVYGVERGEREALLGEICNRLEAAPVQHIGNVLVVYRANPEAPLEPAKPVKKNASRAKPKSSAPPTAPRRRLKK